MFLIVRFVRYVGGVESFITIVYDESWLDIEAIRHAELTLQNDPSWQYCEMGVMSEATLKEEFGQMPEIVGQK